MIQVQKQIILSFHFKIFQLKKPQLLTVFKTEAQQITSLSFDTQQKCLLAGTRSKTSILISFQPTTVIRYKFDNSNSKQVKLINQNSKYPTIFSANSSGSVTKMTTQISNQKKIVNKKVSIHPLTSIAINQQQDIIAISEADRFIKIYSMNLDFIKSIECHNNWVNFVDFSQTGRYLISCSDDQTIAITDTMTYTQIQRIQEADGLLQNVKQAKFINENEFITIGFQECQIWNWRDKTLNQHYSLSVSELYDCCTSKNGKFGFVACGDGVKILDLQQGRIIFNIKADCATTAVDVSEDNSILACGLQDGRILLFELEF